MQLKYLIGFTLIFCSALIFAQTSDFEYVYCLREVHFSGSQNTQYIPIRKDDNSEFYTAPQFVQDCSTGTSSIITTQNPVAYVSGKRAKVKAIFETNCTIPIYIRGVGPEIGEGADAEELIFFKDQPYTPINGILETDEVKANERFISRKVKYWENFTIKWQFSVTGEDDTWVDVAESVNTMYVTHDMPIEGLSYGLGTYKVRHSSIHFSCKSANGKSTKDDIVQSIHDGYFSNLNCTDVNGDHLTYWGLQNNSSCVGLEAFFASNDGTCGTWSYYNQEMLLLHGINSVITSIFPNPASMNESVRMAYKNQFIAQFGTPDIYVFTQYLFLVKNWDLSLNYYNLGTDPEMWQHAPGLMGAGAQNNQDPTSIFGDHAFISYNNKFYDPSYGLFIPTGELKDYEDTAIQIVEGVFFKVCTTPNPNGPGTFYIFKSQENTTNVPELTKIP